MAWTPRDIKDMAVQYPNRYQLVEISPGIYDIIPAFGTVTEAGTPINKAFLQPIEDVVAGQPWPMVKLVDITTASAATQVDVSLPSLSGYAALKVLLLNVSSPSGTTAVPIVRMNNLSTTIYVNSSDFLGSGTSLAASDSINSGVVINSAGKMSIWMDINLIGNIAGAIDAVGLSSTNRASSKLYFIKSTDLAPSALSAINIVATNEIAAGMVIKIYGVKA